MFSDCFKLDLRGIFVRHCEPLANSQRSGRLTGPVRGEAAASQAAICVTLCGASCLSHFKGSEDVVDDYIFCLGKQQEDGTTFSAAAKIMRLLLSGELEMG